MHRSGGAPQPEVDSLELYKVDADDLKQIYQVTTELEAQDKLEQFPIAWDKKYPQISKSWRTNWPNLIAIFDYPAATHVLIYTTIPVESLNSAVRKSGLQPKNLSR